MSSPSNDLFHLVHSLTKSEKRRFRLYVGGSAQDSAFIKLFDVLLSTDDYHEPSVLLELRQHTSSGQFHVLKNYLYEKILDSLVDSTASHSDEAKIRDTLQRGETLFRRGLLEQSWRRTRRALDMARDGEFFLLQLEALESLRGLAIPVLGHSGIDEVRSLGVERERILQTYREFVELESLLEHFSLWRYDAKDGIRQRTMVNNVRLAVESFQSPASSQTAEVLRLSILVSTATWYGRFEEAQTWLQRLLDVFAKHPVLQRVRASSYAVSISNRMFVSAVLGDWTDIDVMRQLLHQHATNSTTTDPRAQAEVFIAEELCSVLQDYQLGNDTEIVKHIDRISDLERAYVNIVGFDAFALLWLHIIAALYHLNQTEECRLWITKYRTSCGERRSNVFVVVRMMEIMSYYSDRDYEYVWHLTTSLERYIRSHEIDDPWTLALCTFFRSARSHNKPESRHRQLNSLRVSLSEMPSTYPLACLAPRFSYQQWLQSQ